MKNWSKGLEVSGSKFLVEDQKISKKLVQGTKVFSEKIGPGTKIFRTKIPVIYSLVMMMSLCSHDFITMHLFNGSKLKGLTCSKAPLDGRTCFIFIAHFFVGLLELV